MSNNASCKTAAMGRPPKHPLLRKTPRLVKLPEWLWRWIDEQQEWNRATFIEDTIRRMHGVCAPLVDDTVDHAFIEDIWHTVDDGKSHAVEKFASRAKKKMGRQ